MDFGHYVGRAVDQDRSGRSREAFYVLISFSFRGHFSFFSFSGFYCFSIKIGSGRYLSSRLTKYDVQLLCSLSLSLSSTRLATARATGCGRHQQSFWGRKRKALSKKAKLGPSVRPSRPCNIINHHVLSSDGGGGVCRGGAGNTLTPIAIRPSKSRRRRRRHSVPPDPPSPSLSLVFRSTDAEMFAR
jgi:hypothetical protein